MRHGFGTLSARDGERGEYIKKYSGGWIYDKRHVRGIQCGTWTLMRLNNASILERCPYYSGVNEGERTGLIKGVTHLRKFLQRLVDALILPGLWNKLLQSV